MFKKTNPFYLLKKWKVKRSNILRRDKYECRECKRYGKVTPAKEVHHCFTLEDYPEYKLVSNNLISLCKKCHGKMHNRFTGELTELGKKWMERVRDKVENSKLL
ncbi:HNH endonuclease [Gracilibacillus sp. HCP3S3_G5_1]|uniref:HNH endonuclease n=1 Tax=unclassified Gracilibacillus TaxID=2625209 RepID=UPI003F8A577D